jgi:hypothetical protein
MNSDTLALASVLIFLAVVTIVAWLGGGRKWAFRAMLSLVVLFVVGVVGVVLYYTWDEHTTNVRIKRLHACAVAKVAAPKCVPAQGAASAPETSWDVLQKVAGGATKAPPTDGNIPKGALVCPMYLLPENPTPQQEEDAIATAQKECEEEESKTSSLHEEISRYREERGIKPSVDPYAAIAKPIDYDAIAEKYGGKTTLSVPACAEKIRKKYPSAYNDLDNATLAKKVLAKYPTYCDVLNDPSGREPVIEDVH